MYNELSAALLLVHYAKRPHSLAGSENNITAPLLSLGTLRYEDGELGRRRGWMGKTRSSPVVHAKNKILKIKQFSLGTATAIFLSQTNMSTFKDARTVLLESYLDGVIDDDKFILLCDETLKKPKFPYEFFFIFTWNNDIKIQKYRNNTLNSSSATCFFSLFFRFGLQFSREKVVAISNCPFVNCEINSFNLVQVFSDLFSFLSLATVLFFVPVISRHNISSWRKLHTTSFLKILESNSGV